MLIFRTVNLHARIEAKRGRSRGRNPDALDLPCLFRNSAILSRLRNVFRSRLRRRLCSFMEASASRTERPPRGQSAPCLAWALPHEDFRLFQGGRYFFTSPGRSARSSFRARISGAVGVPSPPRFPSPVPLSLRPERESARWRHTRRWRGRHRSGMFWGQINNLNLLDVDVVLDTPCEKASVGGSAFFYGQLLPTRSVGFLIGESFRTTMRWRFSPPPWLAIIRKRSLRETAITAVVSPISPMSAEPE